jgi:hypothetical protein
MFPFQRASDLSPIKRSPWSGDHIMTFIATVALGLTLALLQWVRAIETCAMPSAVAISNAGEEPLTLILVKSSGCDFLLAPAQPNRVLVLDAPPKHGTARQTELGILYTPQRHSWTGDALSVTEHGPNQERGRTGTVAITLN